MSVAPVTEQQKTTYHIFIVALLLDFEYASKGPEISTLLLQNAGATHRRQSGIVHILTLTASFKIRHFIQYFLTSLANCLAYISNPVSIPKY